MTTIVKSDLKAPLSPRTTQQAIDESFRAEAKERGIPVVDLRVSESSQSPASPS